MIRAWQSVPKRGWPPQIYLDWPKTIRNSAKAIRYLSLRCNQLVGTAAKAPIHADTHFHADIVADAAGVQGLSIMTKTFVGACPGQWLDCCKREHRMASTVRRFCNTAVWRAGTSDRTHDSYEYFVGCLGRCTTTMIPTLNPHTPSRLCQDTEKLLRLDLAKLAPPFVDAEFGTVSPPKNCSDDIDDSGPAIVSVAPFA